MNISRDLEKIVTKLSSDKVKERDGGLKLLKLWIDGDRCTEFCQFLSQKTAKIKPNELLTGETWPYLIKVLTICIWSEITSTTPLSMEPKKDKAKKDRLLPFAKALRMLVERAEDRRFSGKALFLLPVIKSIFNHIYDVLKRVPLFHSEYVVILRHLLLLKDYRSRMSNRVYCDLIRLHMNKVEASLSGENNVLSNPNEEVFRCIRTIHFLLENPPGDFPYNLREDTVKWFVEIFLHIREEGNISSKSIERLSIKLIECVNTYLLKDGPNLDTQPMEIHSAVEFVFRYWHHDCGSKDALVFYARLQLKLMRSATDGAHLIEKLLDVVCKDLDQSPSNTTSGSILWGDNTKDDKLGAMTNSRCGLIDLVAAVFFRACASSTKAPFSEKRSRRENAASLLRHGIMKGKGQWNSAFCFLIRKYHSRIRKDLVVYWFEGLCESFERIVNEGNSEHAYDGLLWVLRSLQELSSVLLPSVGAETSQYFSATTNELCSGWLTIWNSLIHSLPIFSNVTSVADDTMILLGKIISHDLIGVPIVPQDVWELRLFKNMPSVSALYFIVCYFTRKGSQGDLRDILHLRQNLLRASLALLHWKENATLNESVITLLPAAIFSLSVGCAPIPHCLKGFAFSKTYLDVSESVEDHNKIEGQDCELFCEPFECSVEVLAEIDSGPSVVVVSQSHCHHIVRLPSQVWCPLLQEMETYFRVPLMDLDIEKIPCSDLLFLCALLCNSIYCSILTRSREESSSFLTELCRYVVKLLQHAVCLVKESQNDILNYSFFGPNPILDGKRCILTSVKCFVQSSLFSICGDKHILDDVLYEDIMRVTGKLLRALAKLYEDCSNVLNNVQPGTVNSESLSSTIHQENSCPSDGSKDKIVDRIVDMDLDVSEDSKDMDALAVSGDGVSRKPRSSVKWKFDMVSMIASFSVVLPLDTWEVMFNLVEKETDSVVCESILYNMCEKFPFSLSEKLSDVAILLNSMIEKRVSLKLSCVNTLTSIRYLLQTLISVSFGRKDENANLSLPERVPEQSLLSVGDLINRIAAIDVLDWCGRVALIDCICNFVLLDPHNGLAMLERLLPMLQDTDFRVRHFLAKRIGILFQTYERHDEIFQDVCSNFGVKLVMSSKGELVPASEVLATGSQPRPVMETIVLTLAHLAFYSEKIEVEAVFMICAVAALYPCQRELVYAVIDNLSRRLHYPTRSKYLEELVGMIIFSWVTCRVSLAALLEIRDLFLINSEPNYFAQYCCPWLLPALVLRDSRTDLKWIATVAGQPLTVLVKDHFVPIFAICMALHCSKKQGRESGLLVLQGSILCIGEMSEHERDCLIKKHMVSIVSFIMSLSSSASDPIMPFFSKDVIVLAIQTVVDGFLEMDERPTNVGIVDKVNIFRADRVFMFIIEMHYKVTAAVNPRHKCQRLSGVEVVINIIGHRAAISSTSNYLFNLVGQFIGCQPLQDQCCRILSKLLEAFKNNTSKDVISVLGEQLQFLVSKLVACCIPLDNCVESSCTPPSHVLSLLHQLTVDSDPYIFDYIKELEPFPEIDCFNEIRRFHQELCKAYSPRDHFLKFVRRTSYLPDRLLLWSLGMLHKKLLEGKIIQPEDNLENIGCQFNNWRCEPAIVSAVWKLVSISGTNNVGNGRAFVSDFISRVGIGDPHAVVFHLPGESGQMALFQPIDHVASLYSFTDTGIPEEQLLTLLRVFKKYLLDDSVSIIHKTSRALKGILSTERGQKALLSFDSYERSLIGVHSKGVNLELVEKLLSQSERKTNAEVISIEESSLWKTHGKTYDTWICSLVSSLLEYSNNIILRLCQDIVFLKAEVAELLFPNVLANLAGRRDLNVDLCHIISSQVQENVFTETNKLIKSIQVMLHALNELRLYHVTERVSNSSTSLKQESVKGDRPSSYSSKRSRSTSEKSRRSSVVSSVIMSTSQWEKVYWLSIDYLLVAKSAINCGSYFTAVLYVEHWCEEQFKSLTLGSPDFSPLDEIPLHIEILISAVTQINEPDSLYGIIQSHKLTSQIITYEHEGNWSKALEYYDLQVRSEPGLRMDDWQSSLSQKQSAETLHVSYPKLVDNMKRRKSYKGLMRSLQQTGCTHVLDWYCQGLTSQKGLFQHDSEFTELQYEAAWRAGNWDFSLLSPEIDSPPCGGPGHIKDNHFNENLHSCLRALQKGDSDKFCLKLTDSKQELVLSIHHASKESTEYIYSSIIKLQILDHLGMAWDLRWKPSPSDKRKSYLKNQKILSKPIIPTFQQLEWLNTEWSSILKQTQLHMNLLEPFIAFRRVLLQILSCKDSTVQHLLQSASTLRKGSRFSLAAAALEEFKFLSAGAEKQHSTSYICCLGRIEEAKLLRAQGQHEMAINLASYILRNYELNGDASTVYRLVGKWLAETRSSNSRTILDQYLKHAVKLAEVDKNEDEKVMARQCQTHFHLAHYADALYRSYEERLNSNEWQAAMRLRKHKTKELEALIRRLKGSTKGEKTDYSIKIQELQKQLSMDKEETERLQEDRDHFLSLALDGYQRCLIIGDKYDMRVVFRLVSLWFSLSSRQDVIDGMLCAVKEVQSYKFIPLVYQIASRMGNLKDGNGPHNFQYALISLVKKMAIDHPYHTIFQLLALANGDRVKDKQRSRNSFVVDMDKKLAAENLLSELSSRHGAIIRQMKQMVEIYIKLAELETKREDTNKRIPLPREIRSLRQLELVPVVTSTFPVDRTCQYHEGSFPNFRGLADSILVMNGINAPKVVECLGSDGHKYRQLAKSGNDDLRQDAVMEQFFALVNTFLQNHRDTWKRRIGIRTYKVVPFTPSAGVLEWVDGTIPLGEYLLGSLRNGGAHGCYGVGDWSFLECREYMANAKDKRKAFQKVCENFRPVMHYFFLERFLQPAKWFERRLCYTRSVAASSMVGYIVGLGDRHSMNILIDQATAEVVHIDLGVAFEQGLMLKTPERVPFRLTRDIIDGMGVTGVDGVFRRCCEETLSVMRTNKEALLTIIEVFIHDPLYKWALSPLKAMQRQKDRDDDTVPSLEDSQEVYEGNKDAARALMRVKQKLDGYEEGEMRSVHGQVQQLIQDAIDPDRLCQMFPGWGAWL